MCVGGMKLKLDSAAHIVADSAGHTAVFICEVASQAATDACLYGHVQPGKYHSLAMNISTVFCKSFIVFKSIWL